MTKIKVKVKFLVHERVESSEIEELDDDLFAYFPEMKDHGEYKTAYSHIGQHSACSPEYAKESRNATPEEYADLKEELESIGYIVDVLS